MSQCLLHKQEVPSWGPKLPCKRVKQGAMHPPEVGGWRQVDLGNSLASQSSPKQPLASTHMHAHPHMHAHRQAGMHTLCTNAIKRINRIPRALCFLQIKISALYLKIVVGCLIRFSPAPYLLAASLYFIFCLNSSQAFWKNIP